MSDETVIEANVAEIEPAPAAAPSGPPQHVLDRLAAEDVIYKEKHNG